jgi:hypothetical protein
MMGKGVAVKREMGPGEAAESRSRKRWLGLLVASAVVGGVSGLVVSFSTGHDLANLTRPLPIWVAALLAVLWLVMMAYAAWYYETKVDELERNANYFGYAIGGGLVVFIYPVWYLFWWAGFVPEPSHEMLMGLLLTGALAGYLWKKYR